MRNLYWRYVTQGVIDITPVISPQATGLGGDHVDMGAEPPATEVLTHTVTAVTNGVTAQDLTGQEGATQCVSSEPPRAGRSRSARPNAHIPSATTAGWSKGPALS